MIGLTASPVVLGGGKGVTVIAVVSIMNWSANCAQWGIGVFTLENPQETYILEVENTWLGTEKGRALPSWSSTRSMPMRGEEADFKAKVTASTRDCLTRQVREAVLIRRSQVEVLNGKTEWHQPALFRVQSEIERG